MSSSQPDPETVPVDTAPTDEVDDDTQSDPALADDDKTEWASEGGAVEEGPATDVDDD